MNWRARRLKEHCRQITSARVLHPRVLGTATTTGFLAVRSSLLWPGIALAILAVIGLFGGFGFDYLAGHER
jgi:hypothetical protein